VQRPDKTGRFGVYGGKYVPETLIPALLALEEEYATLAGDESFQVSATNRAPCANSTPPRANTGRQSDYRRRSPRALQSLRARGTSWPRDALAAITHPCNEQFFSFLVPGGLHALPMYLPSHLLLGPRPLHSTVRHALDRIRCRSTTCTACLND
jgi:hypothetical protein